MNAMPNNLKKRLKTSYSTLYEACGDVFHIILGQEEKTQVEYFTAFFRDVTIDDFNLQEQRDALSREISEHINGDINSLCGRILDNLVKGNIAEKEFYKKLWEKLCDSTLLPDEGTQIAFLMRLWLDPRLPYYQLEDGRKMNSEEFGKICEKILPRIQKASYIMTVPFDQKTQWASLLLALTKGLSEDEKQVYWAVVISRLMEAAHMAQENSTTDKAED